MGRILAAVAGCALMALAATGPACNPAMAQTAKKAPATKARSAEPKNESDAGAQAMKDFDEGVKAWHTGKADAAVDELSRAINASKLPQQQMAKALYYRGLANRKLGKPALAISDLQSALWLKGALSDSERNEALAARSAAYREAGIADPQAGKADVSANTISSPKPVAAAPQVPAPPAPAVAAAAPAAAPPPAQDWTTAVRGSARPPAAVAAAPVAPVSTPTAVAAAPQVAAAPAAPSPGSGSSGNFLSSLFGGFGGGSASQPDVPERRPPPPRVDEDPDKPKPWGAAQVRPAAGASRVAGVVPPPTTGSTSAAASSANAAYRLQVAAVASKADAEKIAAKLKKEQPKALSQHAVDIDQAESLWRVRVGPYASANEPRNFCVKLRQSGYDCRVVTQ